MTSSEHLNNIEHYSRLYERTKDKRYLEMAQQSKRAIESILKSQQQVVNRLQNKINEQAGETKQQLKLF